MDSPDGLFGGMGPFGQNSIFLPGRFAFQRLVIPAYILGCYERCAKILIIKRITAQVAFGMDMLMEKRAHYEEIE